MAMDFCIDRINRYFHYYFDPGYVFSGHKHADWELNLVMNGQMRITVDDQVYRAERGDFFAVRPWVFHHNCVVSSGAEMVVIHFSSKDHLRGVAQRFSENEWAAAMLAVQELDRLMPSVKRPECHNAPDFANPRKLIEVLLALGSGAAQSEHSSDAGLYAEAVQAMRVGLGERLTLAELAHCVHSSPTALKNAFARAAGKGVMEYFTEMKIHEARRLIESGKSLSYVSDRLGFSSQCYFSTVFRRVLGVCPKDVRPAAHPAAGAGDAVNIS